MVYLSKIYTKAGDHGETMLGTGDYVAKTSPRVIAMGAVDELNSTIGLARVGELQLSADAWLATIQNDLFDLGADLCMPEVACPDKSESESVSEEPAPEPLRIVAGQVEQLEQWIDEVTATLEPLTSFILPGGTPSAATLHHARSVCRRAEVAVWQLAAAETINPQLTTYLNRLSDLLFVLARSHNDSGNADVLWKPGASRS